jgi:hypothetical protein
VADHERARALRPSGPDRLGVGAGTANDPRSGAFRNEVEQQSDGAVFVLGREDLVAGPESKGAQHRIQRSRRVRRKRYVVRRCPYVGGKGRAHGVELLLEPPSEQGHGLALELPLPLLVEVEHRARAGAERAVVQVDDLRIEEEGVARRHAATLVRSEA